MKYTITEKPEQAFSGNRVFDVSWTHARNHTESAGGIHKRNGDKFYIEEHVSVWFDGKRGRCTNCQSLQTAMMSTCPHSRTVTRLVRKQLT